MIRFSSCRRSCRVALTATAALAAIGIGCGLLSAADDPSTDELVASAGKTNDRSFCGSKPIILGIHDGFGINGWSKASMAAVRSEAAKCSNVKQVVRIGQGDLQKSISDINSMVAQGINALVLIPDFGKSQLPAIRNATKAGVKVEPWAADPGGAAGRDYISYTDYDARDAGRVLAEWAAKAIHGAGNIVFLGGPAGNPVSVATLQGIHDGLVKFPQVTLLTGYEDWPITNWDAAQAQKTMTALLTKYPQIDAIINDSDGFSGLGVLRAYEAANRPLVPYALFENNQLACDVMKLKATNPKIELATMSTRNWIGRIAARKAISAAAGLTNHEPDIYKLPLFEDTIGGLVPHCDPKQPPDAYLSAQFTPDELGTYGQTE